MTGPPIDRTNPLFWKPAHVIRAHASLAVNGGLHRGSAEAQKMADQMGPESQQGRRGFGRRRLQRQVALGVEAR